MARLTLRNPITAFVAVPILAALLTLVGVGPASASARDHSARDLHVTKKHHGGHHHATVCKGGPIDSGTYKTLVVDGYCTMADDVMVKVKGDLILKPGAILNAVSLATVHVKGNVRVGKGAVLGLGCTIIGVGCSADSDVRVGGSIIANRPLTMFLDGTKVRRNVVSIGGGPGPGVTPEDLPFNFVVKDNTIGGSLKIESWSGGWSGIIRNTVSGNVHYNRVAGVDPDANEVVHNTVGGNLSCWGNTPPAQFGDAAEGAPPGYAQNVVGGRAKGQCSTLV